MSAALTVYEMALSAERPFVLREAERARQAMALEIAPRRPGNALGNRVRTTLRRAMQLQSSGIHMPVPNCSALAGAIEAN